MSNFIILVPYFFFLFVAAEKTHSKRNQSVAPRFYDSKAEFLAAVRATQGKREFRSYTIETYSPAKAMEEGLFPTHDRASLRSRTTSTTTARSDTADPRLNGNNRISTYSLVEWLIDWLGRTVVDLSWRRWSEIIMFVAFSDMHLFHVPDDDYCVQFYYGNPQVEVAKGILHLYRDK